jgi:PAS domain-containing protein
LNPGSTTIGRQSGNTVVLQSSKISKNHCRLVVSNDEVTVEDLGSSNGTFVNGVLSNKPKAVKVGDRISVGDFVFELVLRKSSSKRRSAALPEINNVIPVNFGQPMPQVYGAPVGGAGPQGPSTEDMMKQPQDFKGKMLFILEKKFMPIFYGMNFKNEWRSVGIGILCAFVLANMFFTVSPLLDSNRRAIVKEAGRRAKFIARQAVDRNAAAMAAGAEGKTDLQGIESADGVRVAVLVDLENRIVAPSDRMNQHLVGGSEAILAVQAAKAFKDGRESGFVREADSSTIVAIEPIKAFDSKTGRNLTIGMAVISLDTSLSTPSPGEIGVVYSETLILTAIFAAILFFVLYRMTLKPFEVLSEDIDRALKGEMNRVTHEFKLSELDTLWDLINSALQRIPRKSMDGDTSGLGGGAGASVSFDDFIAPIRATAEVANHGVAVCDSDRKVSYLNSMFEEITGLRNDSVFGQELSGVARDQAFGALISDLFDRAVPGGNAVSEDFDFSGVNYRVHANAFELNGSNRCYVMSIVRKS